MNTIHLVDVYQEIHFLSRFFAACSFEYGD